MSRRPAEVLFFYLHQTVMQRVGLVHAVLRQHFSDDGLRAVTDGQQEGFVRHIAAKTLAVDF